jgi:hypothetical protein
MEGDNTEGDEDQVLDGSPAHGIGGERDEPRLAKRDRDRLSVRSDSSDFPRSISAEELPNI